jgi:hypothetical protein
MVIHIRTISFVSVYVNPNDYLNVTTILHIVFSPFRKIAWVTFGAGENSMLVHVVRSVGTRYDGKIVDCDSRVFQFGVF